MLCPRSVCLNGSTGLRPWCCAQSSCRALHSPATCLSHSIKLLSRPAALRIALSGEHTTVAVQPSAAGAEQCIAADRHRALELRLNEHGQ